MDLQQNQPNGAMKAFAICAVVLSSILVLAWPLFLMFSAFIFDAPIRSKSDEAERYALLIYVLSYPVGYLVGIAYLIARRIGQPKGRVWWTKWAVFLFLLPIIQLGLPLLILTVASIFDTGKVVKPGAVSAVGPQIVNGYVPDAGKEYQECQIR